MKIGLTGASGTGKTTLAKLISKKYDLQFIGNVARSSPGAQLGHLNKNVSAYNQMIIANTLKFWAEQPEIVSERIVLDSFVYCDLAEAYPNYTYMHYFSRLMRENLADYDVIIYCPWFNWSIESEGVRELDMHYQTIFDKTLRQYLLEFADKNKIITMSNVSKDERMNEIHKRLTQLNLI